MPMLIKIKLPKNHIDSIIEDQPEMAEWQK